MRGIVCRSNCTSRETLSLPRMDMHVAMESSSGIVSLVFNLYSTCIVKGRSNASHAKRVRLKTSLKYPFQDYGQCLPLSTLCRNRVALVMSCRISFAITAHCTNVSSHFLHAFLPSIFAALSATRAAVSAVPLSPWLPAPASAARCSLLGLVETSGGSITTHIGNDLLNHLDRVFWPAGFRSENLAVLVDDEDAPRCAFGSLLEADRADEGGAGIAQERVGQLLLSLESGVGFRAVC